MNGAEIIKGVLIDKINVLVSKSSEYFIVESLKQAGNDENLISYDYLYRANTKARITETNSIERELYSPQDKRRYASTSTNIDNIMPKSPILTLL